jgi:hypothetical protein
MDFECRRIGYSPHKPVIDWNFGHAVFWLQSDMSNHDMCCILYCEGLFLYLYSFDVGYPSRSRIQIHIKLLGQLTMAYGDVNTLLNHEIYIQL